MPIQLKDAQGNLIALTQSNIQTLHDGLSLPTTYAPIVKAYATLNELNAALPPGTTREGTVALVGAVGSRSEYILLNGAWQIRSVIVITGAT